MAHTNKYKNWHVTPESNIYWLYFDRADRSTNIINQEVLEELSEIITQIEQQKTAVGVIIASSKKNGFIAGADIEQFTKFTHVDEALAFLRLGHKVFDQIAALNIPTVAMIKGFCLGGGMELSLACRYRVVEESTKTRLGLPEVLLGIHPGWGGSVRLPRLIGAIRAMDLILTGRTIDAKSAYNMGIADFSVPERHLEQAARYCVIKQPRPHHLTFIQSLTNTAWVRPLLAKIFLRQLKQKITPEHYPAPFAVVNNWLIEGVNNITHAMNVEIESVAKLAVTNTARNLVRVFFLRERLKSLGKETEFKPQHVHVIGAGTMGGDIAAWCALRGLQVTLQDREAKFIAPAMKRAYDLYKKKLKTPRAIQQAMDRLMPDPQGLGVNKADVIIEAIFENLAAKQELFKTLEKNAKPDAVLATNTSSIPLDEINTALKNPARLVGMHFFNPVAMMQLVEVVHAKISADECIDKTQAFAHFIDRLPLPVKSSPGFLVNRILMPYLMEGMILYDEGIAPEIIDKAAVKFGMPMGPIELADTVGLDICLAVAKNLLNYYGGVVPEKLAQMVNAGHLGRKTGTGFYSYRNKKAVKKQVKSDEMQLTVITDRLILRMLNEAVACLREKVVADADLLDAGMILGTGFAPFRGGPIHYAKTCGVERLVTQLQNFAERFGPRFNPDAGWSSIA